MLFPVIRRIKSEVLLHVTTEIGGQVESEHIGALDERQRFASQQVRNVENCITIVRYWQHNR